MGANSRWDAYSNKYGISRASDVVRRGSRTGYASFEIRNSGFRSKLGLRFGVETMFGMRNIENNHRRTLSKNLGGDNGIIKPY